MIMILILILMMMQSSKHVELVTASFPCLFFLPSRCILTPTHLCILMEFAAGGELFQAINRAGRLSEDGALYFFKQLVAGVKYLHGAGVVHRDLKLENTLLVRRARDVDEFANQWMDI